jgi:hypothetical protein
MRGSCRAREIFHECYDGFGLATLRSEHGRLQLLGNSVAMVFAAICVEPTLRTRTSAAEARVDEMISVLMLTAITQKDSCMVSCCVVVDAPQVC